MATSKNSHLPADVTARLGWLQRLVQGYGIKLKWLNNSLTTLGDPAHSEPVVQGRFLKLLEQIGLLKSKETAILSEIEELERRHRQHRRIRNLRRSDPELLAKNVMLNDDNPQFERDKTRRFWPVWLWLLLTERQKKADKSNLHTP